MWYPDRIILFHFFIRFTWLHTKVSSNGYCVTTMFVLFQSNLCFMKWLSIISCNIYYAITMSPLRLRYFEFCYSLFLVKFPAVGVNIADERLIMLSTVNGMLFQSKKTDFETTWTKTLPYKKPEPRGIKYDQDYERTRFGGCLPKLQPPAACRKSLWSSRKTGKQSNDRVINDEVKVPNEWIIPDCQEQISDKCSLNKCSRQQKLWLSWKIKAQRLNQSEWGLNTW